MVYGIWYMVYGIWYETGKDEKMKLAIKTFSKTL